MICILSIAGSDSCGGAGIQADVKTISSLGAHAVTALTAVTAQNSLGVSAIHKIPADFISTQIETLCEDRSPRAVKIGMLHTGTAIKAVARSLERFALSNVVLDPVFVSSSGQALLEPDAVPLVKDRLLPLVDVITPNMSEAETLSGRPVRSLEEMSAVCPALKELGPDVVVTGGHLEEACVDVFYSGGTPHLFSDSRIRSSNTHGTGCVFSSALATFMGLGRPLIDAVREAHDFTRKAILAGYAFGSGGGAVRPYYGTKIPGA
jgi:hydroxymethylpyrimidine kinase/phosphomethylpyrimidine kinase